ncbi:TadE/TadG family type IV pilus assembly protein [Desulfuromonas sp. CSMB_57]|uniref:TadE family protein n=1 Tax=Desulfuromonas sp. CSMB_57 TaxID=2807629 RepID=UPI001CD52246|nr:TadE/TadG family type IV pilus assembly protein [Desulfuromonas sp. CSMB_57]
MARHNQNGAAVVEFAVVLPLLLLIVFGIIEFGFLMYNQAMLTNASREGARAGIVARSPRRSTAEIRTIVQTYCSDYLVTFRSGADPGPQITVKKNGTVADPSTAGLLSAQDYLTVEVQYAYDFLIIPRFVGNLGLQKTLFASATMRAE